MRDMHEKVISLATPVFFLLIALEWLVGRARGRVTGRLNDAVTSIGLGVVSQVVGVFTRVLRIGIYIWLYEHLALAHWPTDTVWAFVLALVFYDLCYYWHHRFMHRVAAAWAAHVVHHSSEDYNLSTALRQTGTGALLGWIPYVPMAIAGVPPLLFGVAALIDLLYQFWIHTEQIGRLGWFDRIFASPSNHRVHHAVNGPYLDRNYGGILIVWDRLFGTFQDERADDPPVYGTRHPLRSFNPVWANLEVYAALARASLALPRWRDRLQVWWRPPGWEPDGTSASGPSRAHDAAHRPDRSAKAQRFDPVLSRSVAWYVLPQFAMILAVAVHFLEFQRSAPPLALLAYAAWIVLALTALGGLLEGRARFAWLDVARHGCAVLVLATALPVAGVPAPGPAWTTGLVAWMLASALHAAWLAGSALGPDSRVAQVPPGLPTSSIAPAGLADVKSIDRRPPED